jgi:hypothetical protein
MRIFYSGNLSGDSLPENLIPQKKPFVMLTYYELHDGAQGTRKRFIAHRDQRKADGKKAGK